jgi:two-component system, cell cycle sensor histidine kinase PleC
MIQTHPLLERLLLKVGATTGEAPSNETWRLLLGLISRTYYDNDQDRYTLERSIDISSREMQQLYSDLKKRSDIELSAQRHRVEESLAILRATLEATHEAMLVVDMNRRVVAWNRHLTKMLQIPDELMERRDHRELVAHATKFLLDPQAALESIENLHASRDITHDEIRYIDGRIVDRYSAPVTLPTGETVARVTYFRDVTQERAATAALERAREAAEAASRAKSMFLANMSHELRTPLNAVIGLADLLLLDGGDPLTKRQSQYLEGIAQSGRHLLAMVNDVLDLAKIEAGKHDLELEVVYTREVIVEAVLLMQSLATNRGVNLVADVGDDVPQIMADPLRLRQVLYNLISNAVKFTSRNGEVVVSAAAEPTAVAISVSDTGIGIAGKDMGRLFRAFEQLEQPGGVKPEGTGLGLALTKRLVEMHGGTINVASELGSGTTFTVRFPVA